MVIMRSLLHIRCMLSIHCGKCVIPVVHHVRGTLSIPTSTAIHHVSVRHLDTADTIMTVTVPSHRFHYRETNSIFLPHSATISMCDACGASCPMHIVNPHYVSVRHLDIADTIITVTVPSHRFHYW